MSADEEPGARVRQALDELGCVYEVLECAPELADTEVFCRHYGIAPEDSANTIVVTSKSSGAVRLAACVVLATTRLDVNKVVRKRLGVRRISFASAEQTRSLTGMVLGGVTPFALPADLPIWIDSRVMGRDRIVLGGGDRKSKIVLTPAVFGRLAGAEVVEGLAMER